MRDDLFFFLRFLPVDLSRYLPKFLMQSPTFAAIENTLSEEHERYKVKIAEIAREFFIETASLRGLEDWERYLKIFPSTDEDINYRRMLTRIKNRGGNFMTLAETENLLREFAPYGEIGVKEIGNYRLKLEINNGNFYWDELEIALANLLPAHLGFSFDINRLTNQQIYIASPLAISEKIKVDLACKSPPPLKIAVGIYPVDISVDTFNIKNANDTFKNKINVANFIMEWEELTFKCKLESWDEDKLIEWERYLRERYLKWQEAVIKYYRHGWQDGEIDNPVEEIEYFPEGDFLRIYWSFPCGEGNFHVRYQTISNPKNDLQAADINYLGEVGRKSGMLLHSKLNVPTTGIIRALHVKKEMWKVL